MCHKPDGSPFYHLGNNSKPIGFDRKGNLLEEDPEPKKKFEKLIFKGSYPNNFAECPNCKDRYHVTGTGKISCNGQVIKHCTVCEVKEPEPTFQQRRQAALSSHLGSNYPVLLVTEEILFETKDGDEYLVIWHNVSVIDNLSGLGMAGRGFHLRHASDGFAIYQLL